MVDILYAIASSTILAIITLGFLTLVYLVFNSRKQAGGIKRAGGEISRHQTQVIRHVNKIVINKDGVEKEYSSIDEIPDPKIRERMRELTKEGPEETHTVKIVYNKKEYKSIDEIPDPKVRDMLKKIEKP